MEGYLYTNMLLNRRENQRGLRNLKINCEWNINKLAYVIEDWLINDNDLHVKIL